MSTSFSDAVAGSVVAKLKSDYATLSVTRDEFPNGAYPSIHGDICVRVGSGRTVHLLGGAGQLQQYNIEIITATRGDTSFRTAMQILDAIHSTMETYTFSVSGAAVIYCVNTQLPKQEDSGTINRGRAKYIMEVQA